MARVFMAGQSIYADKLPFCGKCGRHHTNACPPTCHNYARAGHKAKVCRAPPRPASQRGPGTQGGQGSDVTCFGCGEKGHYKNKCPNNGNQGCSNQIRGTDKSKITRKQSKASKHGHENQKSTKPKPKSLANFLLREPFYYSPVSPISPSSQKQRAFHEKYIHVLYGNDVLIIQGERSRVRNESRLEVISSIRTQRYIEKGCRVFLIQVTKKEEVEIPEKRIEDVPVVRDFPEVFPEDLPRLPLTREVEFHIELILGATPVAPAPYHLAPTEIKKLAEQLKELSDKDKFVIVFIDDILIYSCNKKKHEEHLKVILELLKKEELYAKFSMCEFLINTVKLLGYVIDSSGIHVDPTKIEAIKNWASPTAPSEIRQFLGLTRYYRRFIEGFSKIEKPMTELTQKNTKFN
ncbi:putative reverse transcriptase domain-containing protein [Tanacetum coccineum]